ncbi:MAG: hypothetical protein H6923_10085 [Alphaproteobacteria bacterium]|nr:hypothetical protein [Alphaproteobacteria bacterium]
MTISRRGALAGAGAFVLARPAAAQGPLTLEPTGEGRTLPQRSSSGASVEAEYEILIGDAAKTASLAPLALAYTRFPGGTPSNYYEWRSGHFLLEAKPESSQYSKAMAAIFPGINRAFKDGLRFEDYLAFSTSLGAEPILVANTTTSTPEEQAAWMADLAAKGAGPKLVEMGNEPWIAEAGDPDLVRRWPDSPTEQAVVKTYVGAMRPHLPEDVKICVEAAPGEFARWLKRGEGYFTPRLDAWNREMEAADWFDAVAPHHYSSPGALLPSVDPAILADEVALAKAFDALMACWDDGLHASLTELERQFPGKEIWVTEWNPRGGEPPDASGKLPTHFEPTPTFMLHATARALFGYLRHASVTAHNFFMFNFFDSPWCCMRPDGTGGYGPEPHGLAVSWFAQATAGAPHYRRMIEKAPRIASPYLAGQSYGAVEAAHLQHREGATLLVQNAAPASRALALGDLSKGKPAMAETLSLPHMADAERRIAAPHPIEAGASVELPAYSLTRILWRG